MDVFDGTKNGKIFQRCQNYLREREVLSRKKSNPGIAEEKRNRIEFRLKQLDERLIPETIQSLYL